MTFQKRLIAVMRDGNLRVADLARWFERPHSTVRSWVQDGYEPSGGPIDRNMVFIQLGFLEKEVRRSKLFPVPRLSPTKRIAYLNEIRQGAL